MVMAYLLRRGACRPGRGQHGKCCDCESDQCPFHSLCPVSNCGAAARVHLDSGRGRRLHLGSKVRPVVTSPLTDHCPCGSAPRQDRGTGCCLRLSIKLHVCRVGDNDGGRPDGGNMLGIKMIRPPNPSIGSGAGERGGRDVAGPPADFSKPCWSLYKISGRGPNGRRLMAWSIGGPTLTRSHRMPIPRRVTCRAVRPQMRRPARANQITRTTADPAVSRLTRLAVPARRRNRPAWLPSRLAWSTRRRPARTGLAGRPSASVPPGGGIPRARK